MSSSLCVFLALAVVFSAAYGQVVSYNYASFDASNKADFQFNLGAPTYNSPAPPGYLLLTPASGNQAGSVFLKNAISLQGPNGFKASFSTRFSFSMTNGGGMQDTDGYGADGIVFVVNSVSNNGGSYGGGIGYSGITHSVGIEFDSWKNTEFADIDGNHIGININGNISSVQQASYSNRLNNGNEYYAWVDFNGDTSVLEVRIATTSTRPATAFMSRIVNLVSILGTPNVYVGFTAATGGAYERHMVNTWSFTNQYAPNAVCGNGAIELGESCDGGACCTSSCTFATSAVTCRASAGPCDVAETCSGNSSTCPSDSYATSSTICRASSGSCDVAETCTGSSTSCPDDSFAASSVTCRASNGPCDVAETCTGSSSSCPADGFSSSSVVCRAANGSCDVAETCTGSSSSCPADAFASSSVTCRASSGPCDVAETCTGSSKSCPADSFATSSVVCRASAGLCDVAETCSGSSASCPADSLANNAVVCRPSAGLCDAAETCSGSSSSCPADVFASSSVTCRASAGPCDIAETCSGSSASCPVDSFSSSNVVCRPADGACDVSETCSGTSASCPTDSFAPSSVTCRASTGICDVAETCTGSSKSCPANAFASSSVVCRAANGTCDIAETCTGSSSSCPADSFASSSTPCRRSIGPCDAAETCSGSSATCPNDVTGHFETPCDGFALNLNGQTYSWLDFDVISFNGFVANTGDIEGRAAFRHNAQVGAGWSVGYEIHAQSTDNTLPYSMIVGDDLSFPSGAVYPDGSNRPYTGAKENMFVGRTFTGPSYLSSGVQGSCSSAGCLDSQFEAARQCYGMVQAQISNNADNVATLIQWSGLTVTCNSRTDSTYYMTLTPQQMSQYTYVMFNGCSSTARWVISIGGSGDVTFTGASFPAPAGAVIYNILGSGRTVKVKDTNLVGNVLAPFNNVHQTSGVINGKVIANDITMSLQMNRAQCFTPQ